MSREFLAAHHADHFGSEEAHEGAAQLGMWIFLGTELLLFAALFVAYSEYRITYPHVFKEAREHMEVTLGTINTYLLVTGSILVAFAVWAVRRDRGVLASVLLACAAVLGLGFLGVKGLEYSHHFEEGAFPGEWYRLAEFARPGANLYFTLYFLMTGLHAIHVTVGVAVLSVLSVRTLAGTMNARYSTPVELGGMYWHLVDVIWLFLWPLLYLT